MKATDLESLVLRKQNGEDDLSETIVRVLMEKAFRKPSYYGTKSKDEIIDVFCYYWDTIKTLPDKYTSIGYTFDSYACIMIKYFVLRLRKKKLMNKKKSIEEIQDSIFAKEPSVTYNYAVNQDGWPTHIHGFPKYTDTHPSAMRFKQSLLALCMKCAYFLDDHKADALAQLAGINTDLLIKNVEIARKNVSHKLVRINMLRKNRDRAHQRMYAAQYKLEEPHDEYTKLHLYSKIYRYSKIYHKSVKYLAKVNCIVSNKQVAKILNIPHGTLDCQLAKFSRTLPRLLKNNELKKLMEL